jgi:hypothetical protein
LEYTPWHDTKIQGINEFFYATSPSSIPIKEEAWTPWHDITLQVVASVVLMLEHIWSTHLGTTLKYKVLMIFYATSPLSIPIKEEAWTPWHDITLQVAASVMLMLKHMWSTHLGTTLKYKVLMSFLRNITIVYSNKGRGMDTLA